MKLIKRTYTKQETNKIIDRKFRELNQEIKNVPLIDFFSIYNDIFFEIPKTGTLSHSTLFVKSGDYLNKETQKEKQIKELQKKVKSLETKVSQLELQKNNLEADNILKDNEIINLKER
tara:strand:- start:288 stop:641 length:354 start_codon:yes stop_codon:yes gene_type:complete